jgi:hypothetical protein
MCVVQSVVERDRTRSAERVPNSVELGAVDNLSSSREITHTLWQLRVYNRNITL